MKALIQKSDKANREVCAKADLGMPVFARMHNSFDMALSCRVEKANLAERCVVKLQLAAQTVNLNGSARARIKEALMASLEDPKPGPLEITEMFGLPLKKMAALGLSAVLLLQIGGAMVLKTLAYYTSTVEVAGQIFSAGTLDISSNHTSWVPANSAHNLKPGNSVSSTVRVFRRGSLPFKYTVKAVKTAGDDAFCSALQLDAKLNGSPQYSGFLMNAVGMSPVAFSNPSVWVFTVSLPVGAKGLTDRTCSFDFVFDAWQTALSFGQGFSATETVSNRVSIKDAPGMPDGIGAHSSEGSAATSANPTPAADGNEALADISVLDGKTNPVGQPADAQETAVIIESADSPGPVVTEGADKTVPLDAAEAKLSDAAQAQVAEPAAIGEQSTSELPAATNGPGDGNAAPEGGAVGN